MPDASVVCLDEMKSSPRTKCFVCAVSRCVMHTSIETVGSTSARNGA